MGSGKKCCAMCIGDRYLRRKVFPFLGTETGTCAYCLTEDQRLLEPDKLGEAFWAVVDIYKKDADGETLGYWFRTDWAMFEHPRMDAAHVKELLADILDDGDVVRQRFLPGDSDKSDALERWKAFRQELKHENRFFPKIGIDRDRLEALLPHLLLSAEEIPAKWFRSRIQAGESPYAPDEMSAPPKRLATNGRANPAGIPYLYLASSATTAISELRPHTGEMVSVAEFVLGDGLKIIDLAAPRRTVSPFVLADEEFVLADEEALDLLRWGVGFLEKLGEELTRPVLPKAAAVEYTPSQYLCEFVKSRGFHGVRYKSSVGSDINLALFDPMTANVGSVTGHLVTRVSVKHEKCIGPTSTVSRPG